MLTAAAGKIRGKMLPMYVMAGSSCHSYGSP